MGNVTSIGRQAEPAPVTLAKVLQTAHRQFIDGNGDPMAAVDAAMEALLGAEVALQVPMACRQALKLLLILGLDIESQGNLNTSGVRIVDFASKCRFAGTPPRAPA